MTKLFTILLISAGLCGPAVAQSSGNSVVGKDGFVQYNSRPNERLAGSYVNNELSLETNVLYNAVAQHYVAIYSLKEEAAGLEVCHRQLQDKLDKFIAELQTLGIPPANLHIDVISQTPVLGYDIMLRGGSYQTETREIGFVLKKNIHVRYDNEQMTHTVMDAAARAGIYDLVKVDYIVTDAAAIQTELRSRATEALNRRVEQYKAMGVAVERLINITSESFAVQYPRDRYFSYTAIHNTSLNQLNNNEIAEGIRSAAAEKNKTFYYDKLAFDNYDVVINPVVVAPVVQFVYNLRVKYRVKP